MRHCVKEVDSLFHPKVRWGEDSIFNASAGVGGKAGPTVRVESITCFHQADGADGNKVVLIAGQGVVFFYDVCHRRRLCRISFSRAAGSPACSAEKASVSSRAERGRGKLPLSR